MKYFVFGFIFLINAIAFYFFAHTKQKIKRTMLRCLLFDLFKSNPNHNLHLSLFQNTLVELVTDVVLQSPKKQQEEIIFDLKKHQKKELKLYLIQNSPILWFAVNHLFFSQKSFSLPHSLKAKTLSDRLALCLIYESTFHYQMLSDILPKIPSLILRKHNRDLKRLFEARVAFFKTDLKKASKVLWKNIKNFKHAHLYEEQAYAYFMLGEIYRTCSLCDPADMMFRTAQQIYKKEQHSYGNRFILGSYALNCMQSHRLEEAESCFLKALHAFQKQKDTIHEAEILNQLAALSNMNNTPKKAQRLASKALKKHTSCTNKNGMAFSHQQIAISYFHMNNLTLAKKYALSAQRMYKKQRNESGKQTISTLLGEIRKHKPLL